MSGLIGECAGSPQFTHASEDDFRIIRDNLAGGDRSTRARLVPYSMFTAPRPCRIERGRSEAPRCGRARCEAGDEGGAPDGDDGRNARLYEGVLVGASDDRILGFTMIGAEAGEVMTVVQTAMLAGLPYPKLRDAVIAHPTMAEGLGPLFSNVPALSAQQRHSRAEADPPA